MRIGLFPRLAAAVVFMLAFSASAGASGVSGRQHAALTLASTPRTVALAPHGPGVHGTARPDLTISVLPTFDSSFTTGGVRYAYTMVGTDPRKPAAVTQVKTSLRPLSLFITDAGVAVPISAATVAQVTSSGLFTPKPFPGGTAQYGDGFMRAQFWSAVGNGTKNWHAKLTAPTVAARKTVTIPAGLGAVQIVDKQKVGLADIATVDAALRPDIAATPADTFTIFILQNTVLCDYGCGIGGYHSVYIDSKGPHTYAVASVLDPAVFGQASGFYGLSPASHEVAEWYADPYVGNITPIWSAPNYGCGNSLEVGDPLVGTNRTVDGQVYQDEAFLPWFSGHTSTSFKGRYSWFGTFTSPSTGCSFGP